MLAAGIAMEFLAIPPEERPARMIVTNAALSLTFIPLIGTIPLTVLVRPCNATRPPGRCVLRLLARLPAQPPVTCF